jgi:DNA (cytosine-5)-methyltransferase 1
VTRPVLLDLFSGAGGSAMGYWRAGFEVVGVDIRPMPRYPFWAIHGDALEFAREFGHEFAAVHASPPCQGHSRTNTLHPYRTPELVGPTREVLVSLGLPYVIENVKGAPVGPDWSWPERTWLTELCGCMFPGQLRTYRPRLFETNFWGPELEMPHQPHTARNARLGDKPAPGEFMHVVGSPSGAKESREAMGIDWMQRRELCEAIPPPYTEHVGASLLRAVAGEL